MNQDALVRSHFGQSHTKWAVLLIGVLSMALLFAILASSPPELTESAGMIAIPP
jgi:hypothetical protein